MTAHPERFHIIGFCDVAAKWPGTAECTLFAEADRFDADHLPTLEALRDYAMAKGLCPSAKGSPDICDPIYSVIGEGLEYCNCNICFPYSEIIDNRAGLG